MKNFLFYTLLALLIEFVFISSTFAADKEVTNKQIMEAINKMNIEHLKAFNELKVDIASVKVEIKRLDQRIDGLDNSINQRIDDTNNNISSIYSVLWMIAGIFTAIMATALGITLWDRKTFIDTSVKRSIETMEKEGALARVIDAFKELAIKDTKVAKVLRNAGLL